MGHPETDEPRRSGSIVSAGDPPIDDEKEVELPAESIKSSQAAEDDSDPVPTAELEPVTTKAHSVNHVDSIPNGGLIAWLQVLGSFFIFFNSWSVFISCPPPYSVPQWIVVAAS
jgi:hypothetical protein